MTLYTDIDPFACAVLRENVRRGYLPTGDVLEKDVCELRPDDLVRYRQVHLFCGVGGFPYGFALAGLPTEMRVWTAGFPCIDISNMGRGAGISGPDSGLWREVVRCLRVVRPDYLVLENVAAMLGRGMGTVLGDLAEVGLDAEWDCVPSDALGVRQSRSRLFVLAYPDRWEQAVPRQWSILPGKVEATPIVAGQPEPYGMRIALGPTDRVDIGARIGACANIVIPQVVEWIARCLVAAHGETGVPSCA